MSAMELLVNVDRSHIATSLFASSARGEMGCVEIWESWFEVKPGVTSVPSSSKSKGWHGIRSATV